MNLLEEIHQLDEFTLEAMSYEDLVQLEDQLLLRNELNAQFRIRNTGGRFVLFVLGAILWGILFLIGGAIATKINENVRPLFVFPMVFVTLGLAIYFAQAVWTAIGVGPRMFFRYALHYWPVSLSIVAMVLILRRS